MAKFKFKADERGENKDGLEETAEEHAARVKENQSRRSRGEFTEDETKELEAAAKAHKEQQEINARAKAAREELGLYTGAEKREMIEAQRKQQAQERRDRLEIVRSKFSYGSNSEDESREREHERDEAAHDRADARKFRTALRDPGRYAPSVLKAAQEWRDNNIAQKRFEAEMEMRGKESDNKRIGMVDQGKGKAEVDAAAAMAESKRKYGYEDDDGVWHDGAMPRMKAGEVDAQKEMANVDSITKTTTAQINADVQRDVTGMQTGSQEKIEEKRNQNEIAKMTLTNMQRLQQNEHEMNKLHTEIGASMEQAEFKGLVTTINNLLTGDLMKGQKPMSVEQLREQYKDNPVALKLLGKMAETKTGLAGDAI